MGTYGLVYFVRVTKDWRHLVEKGLGIDGQSVAAHFVMAMGCSGIARAADLANDVPCAHVVTLTHVALAQVGVGRRDALAMLHHNDLTIGALVAGEGHHAPRRRAHRRW